MQTPKVRGFQFSSQQARLWSLQTASQAYHAQYALRVEGVFDLEIFQQAVQWMIDRHCILRTSFYRVPDMDIPLQVINSQAEVECVVIDLEHLAEETQELQIETCFDLAKYEGFDLTKVPLLRVKLFHLSINNRILLISLPALCADDTTLLLFATELSQTYALMSHTKERQTCPLGILNTDNNTTLLREEIQDPLQYVDVAAWQDELLLEEEAEQHLQYWRNSDLSQITPMCLGEEKPVIEAQRVNAFWPEVVEVPITAAFSEHVRALTDQYHISLSAYLLMCWYILLRRVLTQCPESPSTIIIGTAYNGRFHEELASALGLYTRFVPVGLDWTLDMPFEQGLILLDKILAKAQKEQVYFTWDRVTELAASKDGPMGNDMAIPFFPISYEYQTWPATIESDQLTFSLCKRRSCSEPFELKLSALQVGEHLQLELQYDPQKICVTQVCQLATFLRTLLEGGIIQPSFPLNALPLLSKEEQVSLLQIGRTSTRPLSPRSLHQLFEEQAELRPNHLAVISRQEQLTYRQLNEQANRLAWALRQRGVGTKRLAPPATPLAPMATPLVALCLPRTTRMLVGLLGILTGIREERDRPLEQHFLRVVAAQGSADAHPVPGIRDPETVCAQDIDAIGLAERANLARVMHRDLLRDHHDLAQVRVHPDELGNPVAHA